MSYKTVKQAYELQQGDLVSVGYYVYANCEVPDSEETTHYYTHPNTDFFDCDLKAYGTMITVVKSRTYNKSTNTIELICIDENNDEISITIPYDNQDVMIPSPHQMYTYIKAQFNRQLKHLEQDDLSKIIEDIESRYDKPYSEEAVDYYLDNLHECQYCLEQGSLCDGCEDSILEHLHDTYRSPW